MTGLVLAAGSGMRTEEIEIAIDGVQLAGTLTMPPHALGLVIFAHGSGSSRHCPRDRRVAHILQRRGFATLLFDLLTVEEAEIDAISTTLKLDVDVLAERLIAATDSVIASGRARGLPLAYFGGSTGAAAALIAAARRPAQIAAVVARGGRPDLARSWLPEVVAPTLFLVGGKDLAALANNREAAAHLSCEHRVEAIEGASHLFEEPRALDRVARAAASWLVDHLATRASPRSASRSRWAVA